jgi:hypothetical protein
MQHLLQKACIKVSKQQVKSELQILQASSKPTASYHQWNLQHEHLIQILNSDTKSWLEEPKSSAAILKPLIKSWSPNEPGDLKKVRELWSKDVDDAQDAVVDHHLSASIWFVLQNPLYPDERSSKGAWDQRV